MNREESVLLIIDVQTRLAPAVHDGQRVVEHCVWLAELAARLGVPAVVTEHFPEKIGETVDSVKAATHGATYVRKECFSAASDGCFAGSPVERRSQVVVCGTEAHVCLQQTALELAWSGKKVFVAADAAGSRDTLDRDLAFARMRQHGIEIVSCEMVAFEWLRRGGTVLFGEINREFLR